MTGPRRLPARAAPDSSSPTPPSAWRSLRRCRTTRAADDVLALVRTGVMRGASVEMRVSGERFESGVRIIERASLSAIGIVDTPAYP